MLRRLMKLNPDAIAPTLVIALINLAKQHSDLGNWVAGLAAAEEAVSVLEPLAAQNAASFEPGLATALINQSVLLSRLGRKHDAVEASTRATQLVTRLILVNPLRFAPDMASAFAVHAAHLNDVGRREEALEDLENALRMWRKLTAANPAHEPELARSLRNLGLLLSNLGRGKEALSAAQEANALWTKLAADEPRAFDLDLGRSLESLSGRLADEGRTADALAPAEQAVAIFRRLATGSARFQPELAESLGSLSSVLGDLKRWPDALAASREAVTVWERLADGDPEPFEPRLARGLERLLADLSRSGRGRHQDAVPTAERLVAIRRRQVAADPARLPDLATALHGLGAVLRKSGRRREAWAVAWEVGHLGQERDRSSPSPVSSGPPGKPADVRTARALTERARDLASAGRKTEALAAHEEATQMWRTLAHRNSLCRPDLAQSLIKVTILLGETGEPESAIAAGDEAVAIYRQLAPENPEEYEPQLARSLTLTAWSRLLAGQGRLPPCADELAEAAKIYQRLATAQPGTYADPLNTVQSLLADLREGPGNGPNS
jgi:tetratricopeptide (TPR) repeat protein